MAERELTVDLVVWLALGSHQPSMRWCLLDPDCLDRVIRVAMLLAMVPILPLNRANYAQGADLARWAVISTLSPPSGRVRGSPGFTTSSDPFPTLEGILPENSREIKNKHRNRIREKLGPLT
jgi:hypothetical protein